MKKFCAALVLASLWSSGAQAQEPSPQQLYQRLSPSVWLVRTFDRDGAALAAGSAVVIGPEALLTNCHVLRRAARISIQNDNVAHEAKLQYLDPERDLCQVNARNLRAPAVELGDSDAVAVGQKVYTLGNPRGLERTFSDGLVSALRRSDDQRQLMRIQFTAPISHGSSGGGLFDAAGRLVGITSSGFDDAQNLNFAIPINWVRDLPQRSAAALQAAAAAKAPPVPTATGSSDVNDVNAVPVLPGCREEYRRYIATAPPKAFALNTEGKCAWAAGRVSPRPQLSTASDPAVRAMELCVAWHHTGCSLYAVDSKVVYKPATNAAPAPAPAAPGKRGVNDVAAIPVNEKCREEYRKFVDSPPPRAFAITTKGDCAWQRTRSASRPQISADPDPAVRAMAICRAWYGPDAGCGLYAVDDKLLWQR